MATNTTFQQAADTEALRAMLDAVGLEYELELFSSQMGQEGKGVEPLVGAIRHTHQMVVGKPPPPIDPAENSIGRIRTCSTSWGFRQ